MKRKAIGAIAAAVGVMMMFCGCDGSRGNNISGGISEAVSESSREEISSAEGVDFVQFSEIKSGEKIAVIATDMGEIKVRFFEEVAPLAVRNFIELAESGYYNGLIIHKATSDFIQSGDPTGTGTGGESIYKDKEGNSVAFEDEFSRSAPHFYGALAMANEGEKDTNRSQFFIVANESVGENTLSALKEQGYAQNVVDRYAQVGGLPHYDFEYTVFGCVISGMDVVERISAAQTYNGKPIEDIVIERIDITHYN